MINFSQQAPVDEASPGEISLIVIPDTQVMTRDHPELFATLTERIVQLAEPWNVQMVFHLGDVVNDGADDERQYRTAASALRTITDAGLPLMIAPGNHDYDNQLTIDRSLALFRGHLGPLRPVDADWFGVTYEPGAIENSWATISAPQGELGFLTLEFGPRDAVLEWAAEVLSAHPQHHVFVNVHSHLYVDGTRTGPDSQHNPKIYPGATNANDGEDVWQKLLRHQSNVVAVFSGHHIWDNVSHRVDPTDHGSLLLQSFQNWQGEELGGAGRFRIVTFDPQRRTLRSRVCNPATGESEHVDGYDLAVTLA